MKKVLFIVLVAVLSMAFAGVAFAGVVSSAHDLTVGDKGNTNSSQPCVFCHHPHRGNRTTGGDNDLLWNLNVPQGSLATYVQSGTMDATTTAVSTAAPQSFLCMSCHSGSIAAGALLVQIPADGQQSDQQVTIGGNFEIGGLASSGKLTDDHPVNFDYDDADAADAGIQATTSPDSVVGASTSATYPLFDSDNIMQCATCHNVHMGNNSADPSIQFMRANTEDGQMCLDCHINK